MLSFKFEKKLRSLGIKSGDKILVTSDVLKFLINLKKKKKKFSLNNLIDILIKIVGKKGSILLPTFNWDFCKGKNYNYISSKSMTGALSNIALKRKDFARSKNPIYSFAVIGKDKNHVCSLRHTSCFGLDSPFGYLIKNKAKNLCIGMDYKDGFTFVHVAEEKVGVNYRFHKNYSGYSTYEKEKKIFGSYKMYVRDLSMNVETKINKKLDKLMSKSKAIKKESFLGVPITLLNIATAYNFMVKDLKNGGNLVYPKKIKI